MIFFPVLWNLHNFMNSIHMIQVYSIEYSVVEYIFCMNYNDIL